MRFRKHIISLLMMICVPHLFAGITVDVAKEKQEFLGFGVQIWPGQEALEPAYAELGIRWVRLSVPGMRECPLMEGTVDEFAAYFQPKIVTETFRDTMEMLKRNRVTLLLNAFSIPVVWQDQEKQLPNERLELFARMWAGAVKCLVENGMPPQWLELFNEPDGTWSGRCWPDKYNKVVKAVRRELDALGYDDIQICGPGLAHVDLHGPDKWVDALDAEGVDALGAWSLHGYEWHRRESAEVLREELTGGFLASVKKQDPQGVKPLFITEFGTFCTNYHGQAYVSPRDAYVEKTAAQVPAWNTRVIENGLSFLNEGINTLIYWQLADIPWEETNFGIYTRLQDGGQPQMVYSALRGLFPEIAEGFHVLETEQDAGSDLYAVALRSETRLVCCIVNHSDRAQETKLRMKGFGSSLMVRKHVFEDGALCSTEPMLPVGGSLEVMVPGDGYVTLVLDQENKSGSGMSVVHLNQKKQEVLGFGGCAWAGDRGALAVMKDLGMSWVRFNLEGINSFDQPDLPVAQYEDYFEKKTEWDRIKYMWAFKKSAGLTYMLVSFGAPPCWMDENRALKTEHLDDFARLWAAAIKVYAKKGFALEYIELFNEPDGDWDVYCSPENYNTVVKAVRCELDQAGLQQVGIVGPGRAHIDVGNSDEWVDALDAQAVNDLAAFSVHGWTFDGPKEHSSAYVRDSAQAFLRSAAEKDPQRKKPRIMTEFSTKDTVFNGDSFRSHASEYKNTAADSHPFAVHVAEDLLSHLADGFDVILFWQMSDQWWEKAGWGLIGRMADGYPRKPVFQALETILPEIGKSRVVAVDQSGSDVYTAAFIRGKQLTVVLVNSSTDALRHTVRLDGADASVLFKRSCFSRQGRESRFPRQAVSNVWNAELPPESITVAVFDFTE